MPNATLAIVAGLGLAVVAMLMAWRGNRKSSTTTYLKGATVSRQWLMEHQGDDRS